MDRQPIAITTQACWSAGALSLPHHMLSEASTKRPLSTACDCFGWRGRALCIVVRAPSSRIVHDSTGTRLQSWWGVNVDCTAASHARWKGAVTTRL